MPINYGFLEPTAAALNVASKELSDAVAKVEEQLQKLNLGVSAVHIVQNDPSTGFVLSVGYTKYEGRWGIVVSSKMPKSEELQVWHFENAPRQLRARAVEGIGPLLMELEREAQRTLLEVKEAEAKAKAIARSF